MPVLRETARAKLNLTLEIMGRRADGYHKLQSLVAFAGLGDSVELTPERPLGLLVEGPFAHALSGENLIMAAAESAKALEPGLKLGQFRLVKNLPVAAGLGGGSADAAAALRLIVRANGGSPSKPVLSALAVTLGSDVNVCLASLPALITGRGERVEPVHGLPSCGVLLVNPGIPLATAAVYAALKAEPVVSSPARKPGGLDFAGDFDKLVAYALPRENALEGPAARLVPAIREVLAALTALNGVRIARLSGSGPTCFALFATPGEARHEAEALASSHPTWWIAATRLEGSR